MRVQSPHSVFCTFVLLGFTGFAAVAVAAVTTHKPGAYKLTEFDGTGENIPLNGPVIHVFSKDGKKYTSIANDNENLTHASTVGGICGRRSQDFSSASVEVAGTSHSVSGSGGHVIKNHTESFTFPFTLPDIARTPVAACTFELDKRVSQSDRTREYWMKRGFVVRYENAYEAKFTASCSGGIAHGEFVSETIKTPVWIACAATDVVEGRKPVPVKRMEPSRARPMPLKVNANLEATKHGAIYAQKCPVTVRYTGSIFVSRPNFKVTYQITGSDWESPQRTITIKSPGNQEITGWTQYYREKERNSGQISNAPSDNRKTPDASGTVVLKVEYEGGKTQSDPIPYEVFCNAEAPKRATFKIAE